MSKQFKPHLATDADVSKLTFPLEVQYKIDGCFTYNTKIFTNKGILPLGYIVENKLPVKVFSYNEESGTVELKPVVNFFENGIKETYKFKDSRVTANHKFYDNGEWKPFSENPTFHVIDGGDVQGAITGMLLGDSCLCVERREGSFGSFRLKWSNCESDVEYGREKVRLFENIFTVKEGTYTSGYGTSQVSFTGSILSNHPVDVSHLYCTDHLSKETYGKRLSHISYTKLKDNFTDLSLALWFFDDGTLNYNNGNYLTPRLRLCVSRYSPESIESFLELFRKRYNVHPTFKTYGVDKSLSFTTKDSLLLLVRISEVAGGMLPRKIPPYFYSKNIPNPVSFKGVKPVVSRNKLVSHNTEESQVYDIEVEGNHNYFANGVLVHNCRMLVKDGQAVGRSLKKYKNLKLTEYFSNPLFEGFDMEVGATSPNDPDLCRLSTSLVNTIKGKLPSFVVVFDYLTPESLLYGYNDRMKMLQKYLDKTEMPDDVEIIVSSPIQINSEDELLSEYTKALSNNYEGLIIRTPHGLHKSGRCTVREGHYLRMKPTGDSEGVVLRLEEMFENQNEAKINELGYTERSSHKENKVGKGMVGALWLKDIHSGVEIKVGAGKLTHEERKYYWDNPDELLGQLVKYAFLATGQKDKPRHPRYISHRAWEDMSK